MMLLFSIAFVAGALTAFTPCALPVLPVVLSSNIEGRRGRTTGVIVGLVLIFVIVTLFLSSIIKATGISPDTIRGGSVVILLLLGLMLIVPDIWHKIQMPIERFWSPPILGKDRSDFVGGLLTGGSLGVVWTPCVGPIVAAVTALTTASPFSAGAFGIASFYGAGIGVSLWFIALGSAKALSHANLIKRNTHKLRQIFGGVVIVTAIFIFIGGDRVLQEWTLQKLPKSWTQAGSLFQDNKHVQEELKKLR